MNTDTHDQECLDQDEGSVCICESLAETAEQEDREIREAEATGN